MYTNDLSIFKILLFTRISVVVKLSAFSLCQIQSIQWILVLPFPWVSLFWNNLISLHLPIWVSVKGPITDLHEKEKRSLFFFLLFLNCNRPPILLPCKQQCHSFLQMSALKACPCFVPYCCLFSLPLLFFVGNVRCHLRWEPTDWCLWAHRWLSGVLLESHSSTRDGACQCTGGPAGWKHTSHQPVSNTGMWNTDSLWVNQIKKIKKIVGCNSIFILSSHLVPHISSIFTVNYELSGNVL